MFYLDYSFYYYCYENMVLDFLKENDVVYVVIKIWYFFWCNVVGLSNEEGEIFIKFFL